jgi:hypothetical protein
MSKWHHTTLIFAVGSVLGAVMIGSGPTPAAPACKVPEFDCREADGFCVAQSEPSIGDPPRPPSDPAKRLRICDNGARNATTGESGYKYAFPAQNQLRKCYCFTSTYIAACDSVPPPGTIKLTSCGTNSAGQCCFGDGRSECDTLHNSYQQQLSPDTCTGSAPANP